MNRWLVFGLLVEFFAVSAWSMWEVGYFGIFAAALSGPGEIQVFNDLVVACFIASAYVYRDARSRGINPWPWLAAVLPLGSIPLITYLALRDRLGRAPLVDAEARG